MVRDVRTAPPPPADPPADPNLATARALVDDLVPSSHAIGKLMLEVVPAYLSDTDAADVLALLCEQIRKPLNTGSLHAATRCRATAAHYTALCCSRCCSVADRAPGGGRAGRQRLTVQLPEGASVALSR